MHCDRCGKKFRHCDSYFIVVEPVTGALNVHPDCRHPREYPKPPKPAKWIHLRGYVTDY